MRQASKHILLMPALGLLVLAGATVDLAQRPRAADAEKYHQKVREAAAAGIPKVMGEWTWDENVVLADAAAIKLLKPNVLIQRQYRKAGTNVTMVYLLDQCPDARNMLGHYPPVCYAGQGMVLTRQTPVTLHMVDDAGDTPIGAMEYIFLNKGQNQDTRTQIFNFMILPSGRYVTDMDDIYRAAADFGQRFRGAAQMQFVFGLPPGASESELTDIRQENQKTVETFLSTTSGLLKLIYSGGRP